MCNRRIFPFLKHCPNFWWNMLHRSELIFTCRNTKKLAIFAAFHADIINSPSPHFDLSWFESSNLSKSLRFLRYLVMISCRFSKYGGSAVIRYKTTSLAVRVPSVDGRACKCQDCLNAHEWIWRPLWALPYSWNGKPPGISGHSLLYASHLSSLDLGNVLSSFVNVLNKYLSDESKWIR